jgi:hypothetical protein
MEFAQTRIFEHIDAKRLIWCRRVSVVELNAAVPYLISALLDRRAAVTPHDAIGPCADRCGCSRRRRTRQFVSLLAVNEGHRVPVLTVVISGLIRHDHAMLASDLITPRAVEELLVAGYLPTMRRLWVVLQGQRLTSEAAAALPVG